MRQLPLLRAQGGYLAPAPPPAAAARLPCSPLRRPVQPLARPPCAAPCTDPTLPACHLTQTGCLLPDNSTLLPYQQCQLLAPDPNCTLAPTVVARSATGQVDALLVAGERCGGAWRAAARRASQRCAGACVCVPRSPRSACAPTRQVSRCAATRRLRCLAWSYTGAMPWTAATSPALPACSTARARSGTSSPRPPPAPTRCPTCAAPSWWAASGTGRAGTRGCSLRLLGAGGPSPGGLQG